MSQHEVLSEDGSRKWVFGWDQPLKSFFLQVHHLDAPEDEQIVYWLGATPFARLREVEDLVKAAKTHDLQIDHSMQVKLYGEKDDGV